MKKNTFHGILYGASGSLWWGTVGVFYFKSSSFAGPIELVVHRTIWTAFSLIITTSLFNKWDIFFKLIKKKREMSYLLLTGILIFTNWSTWIYAVVTNKIVDASFGYFIMPILSVFLGILFLKEAYNKLPPSNDIIIISDLDEIPSKDKISFIKSCDLKVIAPVTFNHALFHLDCNYLTQERWLGSIVITKELMDKYEPQVFRDLRNRISHFNDAGWSFTSFGGVKKVREKLEAFCHEEYNKEKYKNEAHINRCFETGSDLFYREVNKKKVGKSFFPKDLLKLMEENPTFYFGSKTTIK